MNLALIMILIFLIIFIVAFIIIFIVDIKFHIFDRLSKFKIDSPVKIFFLTFVVAIVVQAIIYMLKYAVL